jgi:mannobiose 2-epimerase
MIDKITNYRKQVELELMNINSWWMDNLPYNELHNFHGEIDNHNNIISDKPISLVMITRMLWSFSASCELKKDKALLLHADAVFKFIHTYFLDNLSGGMFWAVNQDGSINADKKQIYGLAFAIYACSTYYVISANPLAIQVSNKLYKLIEQHSFDKTYGGYIEAFHQDWTTIDDLRLSHKDANERKTMNTHLHVLEAYVNLYKIQPNSDLALSIQLLLYNFKDYIIDPKTFNQNLFFDDAWNCKSKIISFGHDIEAAWLLYDAAITLGNFELINFYQNAAIKMAEATIPFVDLDGGMWNEINTTTGVLDKEKHWWPQAEAMVGFLNAYELTKDETFLNHSLNSWEYIQKNIIDKNNGEWFWGYSADGNLLNKGKAGFWKCPYHNSRACIEVIKRTTSLLNTK